MLQFEFLAAAKRNENDQQQFQPPPSSWNDRVWQGYVLIYSDIH
jgi:hypothetical protein